MSNAIRTSDDRRAALIYPVTVKGEEHHTKAPLEGLTTRYAIRMVSVAACREWLSGVRANEARGTLRTVKVSAVVVDTLSGDVIEVLA